MPNAVTTYSKMYSPIGEIYVFATYKGVCRVVIGADEVKKCKKLYNEPIEAVKGQCVDACKELKEYFDGSRKVFDVSIDIDGTQFRKAVWGFLPRIPYGHIVFYSDIAEWLDNPYAFRAVGGAVGANPIPIILPCHRVVALSGLGGYAFGLDMKEKLLDFEGKREWWIPGEN